MAMLLVVEALDAAPRGGELGEVTAVPPSLVVLSQ
jgi:hypothetical protein